MLTYIYIVKISMFGRVILGIIGVLVGLALIKYREPIQKITGPMEWGEKLFGSGGTFTFLVLVGSLTVIISILHIFGFIGPLLTDLFGRFF